MLKSLSIENFAIIDKLEISFEKGFSVITGETGAGKSIILGALGLVLGQRAETKTVKEGAKKCIIEAEFEIGEYNLQSFFEENDLDYNNNCIIRREINANGKSRSFVNDTPINLAELKQLGLHLIDIHSQHENLLLNDKQYQLSIVDIIAKNQEELENYQKQYSKFSSFKKELTELTEFAAKSSAEKDYFQFQFDQLFSTNLKAGEKEELEEELQRLSHTEEIKTELSNLEQLLSNDSKGVILNLKESLTSIQKIANYIDSKELEQRLNSAYIDLKDLAIDIEQKQSELEFNPERLDFINQRLDKIYTLEQKHQITGTEALIALQEELENKLQKIESFEDEIKKLQQELDNAKEKLTIAAKKLNEKRNASSKNIASHLISQLASLGMKNVRFQVLISEKEEFSANGKDQVEFLFSANENSTMQAISQVASGGEISRVMLSLKALIADKKALPTIIFDEIDTGVSGEISDKMATIMSTMSKGMQVICITHLPQIAAKGNIHYKVFKEASSTQIKHLNNSERITEIALMLSGAEITEAAILNAKTLLSI